MTSLTTPTADEPYTTDGPVTTRFMDMHSGGIRTTPFNYIHIELPLDSAVEWFVKTFGEDPGNIRCQCCGPNLSVQEHLDLRQSTAYDRNCQFVKVTGEDGGGHYIEEDLERFGRTHERTPLDEFIKNSSLNPNDTDPDRLILTADDLPEVWAADATAEPSEETYY